MFNLEFKTCYAVFIVHPQNLIYHHLPNFTTFPHIFTLFSTPGQRGPSTASPYPSRYFITILYLSFFFLRKKEQWLTCWSKLQNCIYKYNLYQKNNNWSLHFFKNNNYFRQLCKISNFCFIATNRLFSLLLTCNN